MLRDKVHALLSTQAWLYNGVDPAKRVLSPLLLQRCQRLVDLQRSPRGLSRLSKLSLLSLQQQCGRLSTKLACGAAVSCQLYL